MVFLPEVYPADHITNLLVEQLLKSGFVGEIADRDINLIPAAVDNSIFQVVPKLLLYPKSAQDVALLMQSLKNPLFQKLSVTARGGGTSTNGQCLTPSVMIDFSKYMNQILEINAEQGWARVQPGVVLAQLNAAIEKQELFFAPNVSTASRATIGGMMATDASGKGSKIYGKTANHLLGCKLVDYQGVIHSIKSIDSAALEELKVIDSWLHTIYSNVSRLWYSRQEFMANLWPKLPRYFAGYNLKHFCQGHGPTAQYNLLPILAGAEGTLGLVTEITVQLTKKPQFSCVFVLAYKDFETALADAASLAAEPCSAIETMDEKVLATAKPDQSFQDIARFLFDLTNVGAMNFVEIVAEGHASLQNKTEALKRFCQASLKSGLMDYYICSNPTEMAALWKFRSRSVGILGSVKGRKKPVPFIEDCAVLPENLQSFVVQFKKLLKSHGYEFAMYGHADAGVIHIRPLMDLSTHTDRKNIRILSDEVEKLVLDNKGIFWGEHGKGFRGEYLRDFLGDVFYSDMRQIKTWFDPHNKFNPGKLYAPLDTEQTITLLDQIPLREEINPTPAPNHPFAGVYDCNGNGECFSVQKSDLMCPSFKLTRDPIHSPKGRAMILKAWVQQMTNQGYPLDGKLPRFVRTKAFIKTKTRNFHEQVREALDGCLSCKACSHTCPVRVDIPEFRAKFYNLYFSNQPRPNHDLALKKMEHQLKNLARFSLVSNFFLKNRLVQSYIEKKYQLVDLPLVARPSLKKLFQQEKLPWPKLRKLEKMRDYKNPLILVSDSFLYYFEPQVLFDTYRILQSLGYNTFIAKPHPNGKGLHVKGFLPEFIHTATEHQHYLKKLTQYNFPLVSVEPSIALTYREEYPTYIHNFDTKVVLLHEFLLGEIEKPSSSINNALANLPNAKSSHSVTLINHCSERAALPNVSSDWQKIFKLFKYSCNSLSLGCCGMAGIYGHEVEHQQDSKQIFENEWGKEISKLSSSDNLLVATGYSCREQIRRYTSTKPLHPIQSLWRYYAPIAHESTKLH